MVRTKRGRRTLARILVREAPPGSLRLLGDGFYSAFGIDMNEPVAIGNWNRMGTEWAQKLLGLVLVFVVSFEALNLCETGICIVVP